MSACLNRKLCLLRGNCNRKPDEFPTVKADRVLSVALILAFWHDPSSCKAFPFSFIRFILGGLVFNLADWVDGSSRRLAISADVHKLSVKKWLFNNIAFTAYAQKPVGHYRAITSEILVWTSGGKLMCYCDERFSLWGLQQELKRRDRINCKLS